MAVQTDREAYEAQLRDPGYPLGPESTEIPPQIAAKIHIAMAVRVLAAKLTDRALVELDTWYTALQEVVDTERVDSFDEDGVTYPLFGEQPPDDLSEDVLSGQARDLQGKLFALHDEQTATWGPGAEIDNEVETTNPALTEALRVLIGELFEHAAHSEGTIEKIV